MSEITDRLKNVVRTTKALQTTPPKQPVELESALKPAAETVAPGS